MLDQLNYLHHILCQMLVESQTDKNNAQSERTNGN